MFQMMDRMAELDVVLVMELESLGFVMFQMMNRMFELVWEARDVVWAKFQMRMVSSVE